MQNQCVGFKEIKKKLYIDDLFFSKVMELDDFP